MIAPKHRWFTFSLRTLLVTVAAIALVCSWACYELDWIRQRREALEWLGRSKDSWYAPSLAGARTQANAPWGLRLFGERGVVGVGMDRAEFARSVPYSPLELQRLFPEARVDFSHEGNFESAP